MEQILLCKLVIIEQYLYLVSTREVSTRKLLDSDYFLYGNKPYNEIEKFPVHLCDKIEATNNPKLKQIPQLHPGFGDTKSFNPDKDYWFNLFLLPNGKIKTVMAGTVVCLPATKHASTT